MEKRFRVGMYQPTFNEILGINLNALPVFQSKGLKTHLMKQQHYKALKYLERIPEIIRDPDALKNQLYVATMYDLPESSLQRYVHDGRLKPIDKT